MDNLKRKLKKYTFSKKVVLKKLKTIINKLGNL